MKICAKCKAEKTYEEFYKNSRSKDGYLSYCKPCQRMNAKEQFQRVYPTRHEYIQSLKSEKGCVDCGEKNPRLLHFDHIKGNEDKDFDVGQMLTRIVAWKRIQREIDKCEVRCASCHKKRHLSLTLTG